MDVAPPLAPPWWLPGATGQTVWARVARSRRLVRFAREVLPTPDEDDLILDHLDAAAGRAARRVAARARGQRLLAAHAGIGGAGRSGRVELHGPQLPFVRARSRRHQTASSEPPAAPLSLGRNRGPGPGRADAGAARSGGAAFTPSASHWAATSSSSIWASRGPAAPSARRRRCPFPTTWRQRRVTSSARRRASTPTTSCDG